MVPRAGTRRAGGQAKSTAAKSTAASTEIPENNAQIQRNSSGFSALFDPLL
jgi:hypothetical protein